LIPLADTARQPDAPKKPFWVEASVRARKSKLSIDPVWFSLQEAAQYIAYSEQALSSFVRRGTAPKSYKLSRNSRRFKRNDLDRWVERGGPSQFIKITKE
jgi:predicted DNA-binding transcriptional regulator AlpA